jgi:putative flippase GtrA
VKIALADGISVEFAKYFVGGCFALAVHLLILATLVELLNANPLVATSIGFIVALCVNYLVQHTWVFGFAGTHKVSFPRYVAITSITFVANIALFRLLSVAFGLWYLAAQTAATGIIFVVNFVINRHYTFR